MRNPPEKDSKKPSKQAEAIRPMTPERSTKKTAAFTPGGAVKTPGGNRYVKRGVLGKGSFGSVSRYITEDTKKSIAVKTLLKPLKGGFNPIKDAMREAENGCAAGKRYLTVKPARHTPDQSSIAMPFIEGETLTQFYRSTLKKLPADRALELLEKVKMAFIQKLKELHEKGMVLCDINSGNFKIQYDGSEPKVELVDLGSAVERGSKPRDFTVTPQFASIELCAKNGKIIGPAFPRHDLEAAENLFEHFKERVTNPALTGKVRKRYGGPPKASMTLFKDGLTKKQKKDPDSADPTIEPTVLLTR